MKDKKYFCYEIYKNLAVWSLNGKISYNPCSYFDGFIKTSNELNIAEVWNGPELRQIKQHIEQDIPIKGCQSCYFKEANGITSRRQGAKELYENFFKDVKLDLSGPQSIDYSVGNLCNLKCIICGPQNSTAWISDYTAITRQPADQFKFEKHNQLELDNASILSNLKNIHFHGGGEPLLSNNHIDLLKKIKETKGLGDVHVFYNTNATVRASQELLDLWEECQLVELYFSIDDVGTRFNYQRTGANWDQVVENLFWYTENMPVNHMFKINVVWSLLNLCYLDELTDWHQTNFLTNRLGDTVELIYQKAFNGPFKFGVDHISSNLKQALETKYKNYPILLDIVRSIPVNDSTNYESFWQDINKIDSIRGTKFAEICPEMASLLNSNK